MDRFRAVYRRLSTVAIFALLMQTMTPLLIGNANAAALTQAYVRLSRMKVSTTSVDVRIVFTAASTTGANGKVYLDLDNADTAGAGGFTTAAAPTAADCSSQISGGTIIAPGTVAGTPGNIDFTIPTTTNITATNTYCIDLTAAITTMPNAGGQFSGTVKTQTSAPADVDTKAVAVRVVTDDQIAITAATVPPIFNMTFSANTLAFPTNTISSLNSRTDTSATANITVSTNAASGYIVWAMSGNNNGGGKGSLHSTTGSKYLTSSTAVGAASHAYSSGVEDYGLYVTSITASQGTADAAYDGTGGNAGKFGTLDATKFQPIASHTTSTASAAIAVGFSAGISTSTPAATDYTDTVTFVGAGKF